MNYHAVIITGPHPLMTPGYHGVIIGTRKGETPSETAHRCHHGQQGQ